MQLHFEAINEPTPGDKWKSHFHRTWPAYSAWFLREGESKRPGYMTCRRNLIQYMPELVPLWQTLTELGGGSDQLSRMLSLYRPTPYLVGCSQSLWTNPDSPALIRNYDYHPAYCDGMILLSCWHQTKVIAVSDCLWGVLDGMNEHGLSVALAFGGRKDQGDGFGITLILRYILEFCTTVAEGIEVLKRIPSHMCYSISLIDSSSQSAVVYVNPDRPTEVVHNKVVCNHQHHVEWPEHGNLTKTVERASYLEQALSDPKETLDKHIRKYLKPPLFSFSYDQAFGTLYTAVYRPASLEVDYYWQNRSWHQSFERFIEGVSIIQYPKELPSRAILFS
jgi:predicted choloylglycine hydrolase